MKNRILIAIVFLLSVSILSVGATAQDWSQGVRSSWIQSGALREGDIVLVDGNTGCEIVVSEKEHSAVRQAASFLASDIEKISGYKPNIVQSASGKNTAIHLVTLSIGEIPQDIAKNKLQNLWEAHQILTVQNTVWLVGANTRGTAFAAYTLSERLGIDPIYLWTGYTPEKHLKLVLKKTDYFANPPTIKYRGFFHDDEDILPRPFEYSGYPLRIGDVPTEWYQRFFETALRLRFNMVAPYTRAHRRFEVQKIASDWGLFYTSHHYDILLSNPFGIERFGLGRARNAGTTWDWLTNREGMLNYWRGGVLENREINAIYPVGLRGTDDRSYTFPKDMSEADKSKIFQDVIETQVRTTKELLPKDKQPIFHFTLYTEMLKKYQEGSFDVPADVIIVWTDNNDGEMRALPQNLGKWKHGVYYHLAYFGNTVKQVTHTVTPQRVASEFKKIVDAKATEYMLVNVSEVREYVMEARMIADICWNAPTALNQPDAARRYVDWWSREYFGANAAPDAAQSYANYYQLINTHDKLWFGADKFQDVLERLGKKINGKPYEPVPRETLAQLKARDEQYRSAMNTISRAQARMNDEQKQYFFEHIELGLLIDWRPTQAAIKLIEALDAPDAAQAWKLSGQARQPLEQLELEILRAERPPFESWYRKTWIRRETKPSNVHRSYEQLRVFLSSRGTRTLTEPEGAARPDLTRFTRMW
ncbi:MAG: glycosyl hydrolase 115 family protein [Acidobacteriota bacterium]|nr:glycosyl hydrolase 115 family protein [Acidobacteriota bacterium]